MNAMEKHFLADFFRRYGAVEVLREGKIVASQGELSEMNEFPIQFESRKLGVLCTVKAAPSPDCIELAQRLAPLLHFPQNDALEWQPRLDRLLEWVVEAKSLNPQIANWIGLYLKESAIFGGDSTELIAGPSLGAVTDHIRIPVDRGICGLAIREERVVNVRDVNQDSRHIACSISTKSELVIPLYEKSGKLVAELDIDSNQLDAFTSQIEASYRKFAQTFSQVW